MAKRVSRYLPFLLDRRGTICAVYFRQYFMARKMMRCGAFDFILRYYNLGKAFKSPNSKGYAPLRHRSPCAAKCRNVLVHEFVAKYDIIMFVENK